MNVDEAYQVLKDQPEKSLEAYFKIMVGAYGEEYFKKFKSKQELINDFINFRKTLFYRNLDDVTSKLFRGFLVGLYCGFGFNLLLMQSEGKILFLIVSSILVIVGISEIKSVWERQKNGN